MTGLSDFTEPDDALADPAELMIGYLDLYREVVLRKLVSLDVDDLRLSRLPTGWTPLGLVWHLAHMERRWFTWGFKGEEVDSPWGDSDPNTEGGWLVPDGVTAADATTMLRTVGESTTAILRTSPLSAVAAEGGRFDAHPPTLAWIAFHVLQEYARHAGHLDIAVELGGGHLGE